MAQVIKEIQLEVSKPNFIQAIVAKQYDNKSRYLRVQLVDNGEKITVKDTSSVVINARRSDGGENKFPGTVDAGQGTVLVPLTYWMLELEGRVISDVSVYDADKILTTTNFTIEVERASCQNGSVSVDDADVDVLTGLIIEVQNVKANYDVEHTYFANSTNAISSKGVTDALKKRTAAYFNIKDFIIGSIDRTTGKILSTPKTHLISKELFARSASRGGFSVVTNGDVECDVALYDTDGTLVSYVENVTQGDSEEHEFVPAYQHRYLFTINGATDINNQTDIQHIYDNAKLFAMPTVMFDNLIVDTEVKEGSENPVSGGAVKVYVDEAMDNLDISSDSLNLEDSTDEKISFAVVNGKLVANIKSASDEPQKPTDAFDAVAYEGKTYRDIFITNNLFPCGDFENGIDGVTVKGTPEVVSDVSNAGSHSLKCFASASTPPVLNSTHYSEGSTLYAACCCRVDRRVAGVLGVQICPSAAATYNKDVRWLSVTDGFEKGSCITTFPASTVRFYVGSFIGSTVDIDGYIDDVVLVDLSMFSTMPDQSTMDALYDEYINILTGKTPDVPVVDENSFVISNEENKEIQVADVVEEGNTNPVSSGAVYEALQSVDVVTDNEMSNTSENPVQNKVAKAYVDSKEDLTLKDSTDEKISFSIENGKLIATIKQDTEDTGDIEDTTDAFDAVAYEGKTYRDIFITNNLFPCGDFENGIDGVTVKGTPEVVSDVSNAGSHSLKCFASASTPPVLNSTHYSEGSTLYAACCCRVDRRVAGVLGVQINISAVGNYSKDVRWTAKTDGFEKGSCITTFPASTVRFYVGSFIGSTVDIDGYIDDVVLVDLSMFSTMPDQATMDALYDEYIDIVTGRTADVPSGDPNRFVISNEDGTSIKVADKVEDGNTNPVSSDAVHDALQEFKDKNASFDYTKYNLPILYLTGDITQLLPAQDKPEGTFSYKYLDKEGTCSLKYQGSSSLNYPKKNYTIKFDNKFEAKEGWGEQKKYCLKANYIDFSHSRNVVSAKLWGQVVKSRANASERLSALPNAGAVDGFPVLLVINEKYQGLYTFNIPKDKWMFGISDENSLVVTVDNASSATAFMALEAELDAGSFEVEYKPDDVTNEDVRTKLNAFISAVMNSTKDNFETTVGEHCDLDSIVDYAIFHCLITGLDGESKNYILTSYDMDKWFITSYDMDSTYGLYWNGKKYEAITVHPTITNLTRNKLLNNIVKFMPQKVKARYAELRAGVMSEDNVQLQFYNFMAGIPKAIKDEECKLWSLIPNTDTNNINQIVNQYILRCKYIDEQAAKL